MHSVLGGGPSHGGGRVVFGDCPQFLPGSGQARMKSEFYRTVLLVSLYGLHPAWATDAKSVCLTPDASILSACKQVLLTDLPAQAQALIKQKCDSAEMGMVKPWINSLDLNEDGVPEYHLCCHFWPHGPCSSTLIAKVGSQWGELLEYWSRTGYDDKPCSAITASTEKTAGYHDLCFTPGEPQLWQFKDGKYHPQEKRPSGP